MQDAPFVKESPLARVHTESTLHALTDKRTLQRGIASPLRKPDGEVEPHAVVGDLRVSLSESPTPPRETEGDE